MWNFGDGASTTEFAPVHEYPNPGIYTVSLTATDKVSMKDTTEYITISVGSTFMEITKTNVEVGDSLAWRGQFYKEAGKYHEFFVSSLGCDSIYVLELGIKEANRPPTAISLSNHQIHENQSVRSFIGKFTSTDPDEDETFTYTFTSGENDIDNGSFIISGDSLLTGAMFDFEKKNTYFIRIKVTDTRGASFSRSFTIVILDVDENPVPITDIRLTNHSVDEKLAVMTFVSKIITFDEDRMDYHTYSLVEGEGDADNAYFTIRNDSLLTNEVLIYEEKQAFNIRIQTTDKGGKTYSMKVTVNLNNTSGINLISDSRYNAYFSNDILIVKSPATGANARIEMYNVTGQLVLKETLENSESSFRLNEVGQGIYILNFIEDNQVIQQRRVLKY